MTDIEDLLRSVLAERADDVPPDPTLAHQVRARAAGERPARVARWVTAGVVAVLVTWLVAQGLHPASGSGGPAGPGIGVSATGSTAVPRGRVPLTPGTWSASPDHPGGCDTFARGVPSTPEPPPSGSTSILTGTAGSGSPPFSSALPGPASPSSWGPAGLENTIGWSDVPPAVEAVHWDLEKVLDGLRFGGYEKDDSGRSITVYVVRGPSSAAAAAVARGCARPDVPITVRYVDRGYDQLRGLGSSLSATLPADVRKLLIPEAVSPAMGGFEWAIDVRRNRLCLFATAVPTPSMKHELWVRYGDAVELWVQGSRTLVAPDASWAR